MWRPLSVMIIGNKAMPLVCEPLHSFLTLTYLIVPYFFVPQVARQQGEYLADLFAGGRVTGDIATTKLRDNQQQFKYAHKVRKTRQYMAVQGVWCMVAWGVW